MNVFDIKAGEPIEVGAQIGVRFWRYALSSHGPPQLYSYVANRRWYPNQAFEARAPDGKPADVDVGEQGVHAFKSIDDLMYSVEEDPDRLVWRAKLAGSDGIVIGTVALWGVLWEHNCGYRAEYAQPISFMSSYGDRNTPALTQLREIWQ